MERMLVPCKKGTENLQTSKILVEWLVSKEGWYVLSEKKIFYYPDNPKAALGKGMPRFFELKTVDIDVHWAGQNEERLVNKSVNVVLRPESLSISLSEQDSKFLFRGTITKMVYLGPTVEYDIDIPGRDPVLAVTHNPIEEGFFNVGDKVDIDFTPKSAHLFRG